MSDDRSGGLDLAEIALGYGLILAVIWTEGRVQRLLFWATLAWLILSFLYRPRDLRALGLSLAWLAHPREWRPRLGHAFATIGGAVVFALAAIWIAVRLHTLHPILPVAPGASAQFGPWRVTRAAAHAWGYILWAFEQQFILQDFFLIRLLTLLPRRGIAIGVAALLFSTAHLPNPVLVVLTLIWGAAACALFLRYRNLLSLGVAHAILGLSVAMTVPNAVDHRMRVGIGYLEYRDPGPFIGVTAGRPPSLGGSPVTDRSSLGMTSPGSSSATLPSPVNRASDQPPFHPGLAPPILSSQP